MELLERVEIESNAKPYGKVPDGFALGSLEWEVTLSYQGRTMTTSYYTGPAIDHEPTASDVLFCLFSDASLTETCRDEFDLADELGEAVTRSSRATWQQIQTNTAALKDLLGTDYETMKSEAEEF